MQNGQKARRYNLFSETAGHNYKPEKIKTRHSVRKEPFIRPDLLALCSKSVYIPFLIIQKHASWCQPIKCNILYTFSDSRYRPGAAAAFAFFRLDTVPAAEQRQGITQRKDRAGFARGRKRPLLRRFSAGECSGEGIRRQYGRLTDARKDACGAGAGEHQAEQAQNTQTEAPKRPFYRSGRQAGIFYRQRRADGENSPYKAYKTDAENAQNTGAGFSALFL